MTWLRRELAGICDDRVIDPGHPAYDAVRLLFNGMHDRRPRLICLPRDRSELSRTVVAARSAGIATAIRGGGHNIAGFGSVDDGLVIDLRLMNEVRVDPGLGVAAVGGGATWSDVDLETSVYGLATTGGTFDTTGVGGLTLGGGIGHLMGRYGLACDNVVSFDLVTADGECRTVDFERDPDLDWALRGAGHNFGLVAGFRFRLHPVSHVFGGYVAYPEAELAAAVRLFRKVMSGAPDELTCTLLLERYGPMQRPAAVMSVAYCGADDEYQSWLEGTLRSLEVTDYQVRRRTYVSMQTCLGRLPFGLRNYWSARCVNELPDELVAALVERFLAGRWQGPGNDTVLIEPLQGAVSRVPEHRSVVPFRGARFNITGMGIWSTPEWDQSQIAWARSVAAVTEPYNDWGDGYPNYVAETVGRAEHTFGPAAYQRLREVKRRLDPDNFFSSNYNIEPNRRSEDGSSETNGGAD